MTYLYTWLSADKDSAVGSPGYFSTVLSSGVQIESTATRRAGVIRFTYPATEDETYTILVDLANDLGRSFHGGSLQINDSESPEEGNRVELRGTYLQVNLHCCYLINCADMI